MKVSVSAVVIRMTYFPTFFGASVVVDGDVQVIPEFYLFDPHLKIPRAGLAVLVRLTYGLVAV